MQTSDDVPDRFEGIPVLESLWLWIVERKWVRYFLIIEFVLIVAGLGLNAIANPDNQFFIVFAIIFILYAILIAAIVGIAVLFSVGLSVVRSLRGTQTR